MSASAVRYARRRLGRLFIPSFGLLGFAFLYIPIFFLVLFSFNDHIIPSLPFLRRETEALVKRLGIAVD